jgi:hypothetical protein
MSDPRPTRDTMFIEEAAISNMWEMAAIVEVLERKGLCTKRDLYDIITEFPAARIPVPAFLRPLFLSRICIPTLRTRSLTTFLNCTIRTA